MLARPLIFVQVLARAAPAYFVRMDPQEEWPSLEEHLPTDADRLVLHVWVDDPADTDAAYDRADHLPSDADRFVSHSWGDGDRGQADADTAYDPDPWVSLDHRPAYVQRETPPQDFALPGGPRSRPYLRFCGTSKQTVKNCRQRPALQAFRHPQSAASRE